MRHDVLGGEDAAWLHMEDATNPMVVTVCSSWPTG